jgi:hypothetical protein
MQGHGGANAGDSLSPSPPVVSSALVPLLSSSDSLSPTWRPILQASNQVVLYNPTSTHLPSVVSLLLRKPRHVHIAIDHSHPILSPSPNSSHVLTDATTEDDEQSHTLASNYFQLLAIANESSSRSSTPDTSPLPERTSTFSAETMAEGYFKTFFQVECRLGMGANGSVYLCQVVFLFGFFSFHQHPV